MGYGKDIKYNYNYFLNDEITSENLGRIDYWDYFYEGIRKANMFLSKVNVINLNVFY